MRVRGKPVSCCFTGHRPAKLPWGTDEGDERCLRLKARLREVIARAVEDGYTHFGTLAVGLGSFPFDHPTYLVQSDSRASPLWHSEFDNLR